MVSPLTTGCHAAVSISDEKPLHMRLHSWLCLAFHLLVSISDEKPLHMRRRILRRSCFTASKFQSQTRSRSTCDIVNPHLIPLLCTFQSQTRSRSTCDISDASGGVIVEPRFNLRREAAPHATSHA